MLKLSGAKKKSRFLALGLYALLGLAACAPTIATRGNLLQDDQIAAVKAGTDTQSDILNKLGSPTTKAPFDDKVWYYMGQETEKHGILDPKIDKERIVMVTFDDKGVVKDIQIVHNQRLAVPYESAQTPTSGTSETAVQQFIGNMGRFNKDIKPDKGPITGQ